MRLSRAPVSISIDRSRCVLCGGPNECVLARVSDADPQAIGADDSTAPVEIEPCWCVTRVFPTALTERASATDAGASCICRGCLERGDRQGR